MEKGGGERRGWVWVLSGGVVCGSGVCNPHGGREKADVGDGYHSCLEVVCVVCNPHGGLENVDVDGSRYSGCEVVCVVYSRLGGHGSVSVSVVFGSLDRNVPLSFVILYNKYGMNFERISQM